MIIKPSKSYNLNLIVKINRFLNTFIDSLINYNIDVPKNY